MCQSAIGWLRRCGCLDDFLRVSLRFSHFCRRPVNEGEKKRIASATSCPPPPPLPHVIFFCAGSQGKRLLIFLPPSFFPSPPFCVSAHEVFLCVLYFWPSTKTAAEAPQAKQQEKIALPNPLVVSRTLPNSAPLPGPEEH